MEKQTEFEAFVARDYSGVGISCHDGKENAVAGGDLQGDLVRR